MAAESHSPPSLVPIAATLLVGGVLFCLPDVWAGKIRSTVHDLLAPGQCVLAAAAPRVIAGPAAQNTATATETQWERQARYWQAEAAKLQAELTEAQRVPTWPAAAIIPSQIQPKLRTARIIGWERPASDSAPSAVVRAGSADHVAVNDLVLAPGESILDQGQAQGIAADDLVLAGRSIIGRISRTSRWTSTIQPITDPEFRGQAQIVRLLDGEAVLGAEGILSGSMEGACRLLHISTTDPVAEGDLVFTSLRGVPLSPPLFYGTITRAELRPGEPEWWIEVTPARRGLPPSEVLVLELSWGLTELSTPPAGAARGTP
jgi:cell shape-determining protein MreC